MGSTPEVQAQTPEVVASKSEPENDYLAYLNKRIRAIRKKLNKILLVEEKLAKNQKINDDQKSILGEKSYLEKLAKEFEDLRQHFSKLYLAEIAAKAKQLEKQEPVLQEEKKVEVESREIVRRLVNLFHAVNLFNLNLPNGESPRVPYLHHINETSAISSEADFDGLNYFISLINGLIHDTPESDFAQRVERSTDHAFSFLEGKDEEVFNGVTYHHIQSQIAEINNSIFCTPAPAPVQTPPPQEELDQLSVPAETPASEQPPLVDQTQPDSGKQGKKRANRINKPRNNRRRLDDQNEQAPSQNASPVQAEAHPAEPAPVEAAPLVASLPVESPAVAPVEATPAAPVDEPAPSPAAPSAEQGEVQQGANRQRRNRGPRGENRPPREPRPQGEFREPRQGGFRDNRPPREPRPQGESQGEARAQGEYRPRGPRPQGEFRQPREPREPRPQGEFREPREPREPRPQGEFRQPREPRSQGEFREPREPRPQGEFRQPREPRAQGEFRQPREPRPQGEFRESRPQGEFRRGGNQNNRGGPRYGNGDQRPRGGNQSQPQSQPQTQAQPAQPPTN